jgi:hypothetical protein
VRLRPNSAIASTAVLARRWCESSDAANPSQDRVTQRFLSLGGIIPRQLASLTVSSPAALS